MSTSLDTLLGGAQHDTGDWCYAIDEGWMQGRTAFGGLSAALALDAAMRSHGGEAPLRTAQISFVGPVGGAARVTTRLLRQSKSSRFVAADLSSDLGYGTSATFTFMKRRDSHIDHRHITAPDVSDPDALAPIPDHPMRPAFTRKFDMRPQRGPGFGHGLPEGHILTWVRWVETPACDPHIALLTLADALPPAATTLFTAFGPLSSSTWIQHFLTDRPHSDDGWWLLESRTRHVSNGFSAQSMLIWNSARELMSVGGQGVALYV
ncbi:MAG: thioesterase family protein [Sphingopyxis sp.]